VIALLKVKSVPTVPPFELTFYRYSWFRRNTNCKRIISYFNI
jgi:hypothetical protein